MEETIEEKEDRYRRISVSMEVAMKPILSLTIVYANPETYFVMTGKNPNHYKQVPIKLRQIYSIDEIHGGIGPSKKFLSAIPTKGDLGHLEAVVNYNVFGEFKSSFFGLVQRFERIEEGIALYKRLGVLA